MPPKSVEPPWYGPVCPVVWEGWGREAPPYPDCTELVREAFGRPLRTQPALESSA